MNYTDKYIDKLPEEVRFEEIEKTIEKDSNLEKFIESIKIYKEKNQKRFEQAYQSDEELQKEFKTFEAFYELAIIRKIYNVLGMRLIFDLNFWFGGRKVKEKIGRKQVDDETLEEIMNTYIGNCKIISKLMQKILTSIDINCIVTRDSHSNRRYAIHMHNVITPLDGTESYIIDLENDLRDIQSKSKTRNFGLLYELYKNSEYGQEKFKYSNNILEKMDMLTNTISRQEKYSNDYNYFLKYYSKMFERSNR